MDLNRIRMLAGVGNTRYPRLGESQVGKTILQQMGGTGRLSVMLGAKNFIVSEDGASFRWPNKERSRGNAVRITLGGSDTYTMEFYNVAGASKPKLVKKYDMLYADQLVPVFEKQTGWYLSIGGSKKPAGSGMKPGPEMPPMGTKHESKALEELSAMLNEN
jgi:hypothetical protein